MSLLVYSVLFAIYVIVVWKTPERSPGPNDLRPAGEERFSQLAIGLFLCWWVAFLLPFVTSPWTVLPLWPSIVAGCVIFAGGMLVRTVAVRTLEHYFTYQLCIREEHQLVQHGIYRVLRHPSYTGTILEAVGMLLVARSLVGLVLFGASAGLLFALRIRREEQMMLNQFGDEYRAYMAKTWRLFPGLF